MKGIKNIPCGRKGPIAGLLIVALNFVNIRKRQGEICQDWNYLHIPKTLLFQLHNYMFFVTITSIPLMTLFPLCRRASYLTIIFCCFHFENVGDYAVNGNISNETCEKQFLGDARAHQPECWQAN